MMQKRRLLIGLPAALALAPLSALAASSQVVRLASGEWPPYMSEKLPHHGVASRIVTEAFRQRGLGVKYGFYPWPRALALANTNAWDGTLVWQYTPERARDFYFSDQVIDSGAVFFSLKQTAFKWTSIADLAKYRIGVTHGYFYGVEFTKAVEEGRLRVETVSSDELNFRKLLFGRVQIFPCNRIVGLNMLSRLFSPEQASRFVVDGRPVNSKPLRLMLNKHHPHSRHLMAEFNLGLAELRASGALLRFLKDAEAR